MFRISLSQNCVVPEFSITYFMHSALFLFIYFLFIETIHNNMVT